MPQTVILQHQLPNGDSHFDWMIDQPHLLTEHRLLTFRCEIRPDFLPRNGMIAQMLPDHRKVYLTYEGHLTDNRGSVTRVAQGTIEIVERTEQSMQMQVQWPSSNQIIEGTCIESSSSSWRFISRPPE